MTTESAQFKTLLASLMHPQLKVIDLSLERMQRYLQAIGNPQQQLPPVVHVAGTNGKGSTIAFVRAMLEAAGYSCHVFTSPHLVHFAERVVVAGGMLGEPELMERLTAIQARSTQYPLTFFEANTALAFECFAQTPADCVLLEVGMGGRFDATNVVAKPALCIITPVAMDHEAYLGDTLAKIAYEKAGIIKPNVPVICAPQQPEALEVITAVAQERAAPLTIVSQQQWGALALQGEHQQSNASMAVAAARMLGTQGFEKLTEAAIERGLRSAVWRGRLQRLTQGELVDAAPVGCELWLDGGHNPHAAASLAAWARAQHKPVHLLCAMSNQKNPQAFLQLLEPALTSITLTQIPDEPLSYSAQELASFAPKNAKICLDIAQAITSYPIDSIILIAGSLYLAGHVLQKNR